MRMEREFPVEAKTKIKIFDSLFYRHLVPLTSLISLLGKVLKI